MLPPLALKHFPPEVIEQAVIIYKTALALSYTPCSWLTSRVVFIPKPGKERYTEPKSFRPISLSNYILKGLERVVGWHADAMLDLEPVHTAQHGFTKGRSTESAISNCNDPNLARKLRVKVSYLTNNNNEVLSYYI